jgi:hypothetical protein
MLDDATALTMLYELMDAFNHDDMAAWASHFADDVRVVANDVQIQTRGKFLELALAMRAKGFTAEWVSSASVQNNVLTCHYVNYYTNGTTSQGGVVQLFDHNAKVIEQRSLWAPRPSDSEVSELDDAVVIANWQAMLDAFAHGDKTAFSSALAEPFNAMENDLSIPSRDAFADAVWTDRDRGWTSQRPVSLAARANVLTTHYVNGYTDGTTSGGGGLALFDSTGKISSIRALTNGRRSLQVT